MFRPQQKGADRRPQDPQRSGGALDEIRAQMEIGKYSRASASLKQVLASDPDDPEALRLSATLHIKLGSRVSARAAFDKLVKQTFDQQDYVGAESLLREYLAVGPRYVPFLDLLGQALEAMGDPSRAVEEYAKAVEIMVEDQDPDLSSKGVELYEKVKLLDLSGTIASRLGPTLGSLPSSPGTVAVPTEEPGLRFIPSSVSEEGAQAELEEDRRVTTEAEARAKGEEEERDKAEEEARAKLEELARAQAEAEARAKADAEARVKAEAEARAKAEEGARATAEAEARTRAEQETRAKADAEARYKAEAEARAKAEAEARAELQELEKARAEAQARAKAEAVARAKAEAEARAKADAEARARAEEEAWRKADAEARAKAEEEARIKAEEEARAKLQELEKARAEAEARAKVEVEARAKVEVEARARAEVEARLKAEAEIRAQAEADARARLEEEVRAKIEAEARAQLEEEAQANVEPPLADSETGYGVEPAAHDALPSGAEPAQEKSGAWASLWERVQGKRIPSTPDSSEQSDLVQQIPAIADDAAMPAGGDREGDRQAGLAQDTPSHASALEFQLTPEPFQSGSEGAPPAELFLAAPDDPMLRSDRPRPASEPYADSSSSDVVQDALPSENVPSPFQSPTTDTESRARPWESQDSSEEPAESQQSSGLGVAGPSDAGPQVEERPIYALPPDWMPNEDPFASGPSGPYGAGEAPLVDRRKTSMPSPPVSRVSAFSSPAYAPAPAGAASADQARKESVGPLFPTVVKLRLKTIFLAKSGTSAALALGATVAGLVLAVVLVLSFVWVIMEEAPSKTFQDLTGNPPRTTVSARSNGYEVLRGFAERSSSKPVEIGERREVLLPDGDSEQAWPQGFAQAADSLSELYAIWDPAEEFQKDTRRIRDWSTRYSAILSRYHRWTRMSFDDLGYGSLVGPDEAYILGIHRLYIADGFTRDMDAAVQQLERDLEAWRQALAGAKTLRVKILAAEAINDGLIVASGLLARPRLPRPQMSVLARATRPLTLAERSLRWPMQSQFIFETDRIKGLLRSGGMAGRPLHHRVLAAMPLPEQSVLNAHAEYYGGLIKHDAVQNEGGDPRIGMPKLYSFASTPAQKLSDYLRNPIDNALMLESGVDLEDLTGRILETEARLRLASLQARLRMEAVLRNPIQRIAGAGANFYDPFTGFTMLFNPTKKILYSVGRDGNDHDGDLARDVSVRLYLGPAS